MSSEKNKKPKQEEIAITLRMKKSLMEIIEKECDRYRAPRVTWITLAIVEKLERLGYELN